MFGTCDLEPADKGAVDIEDIDIGVSDIGIFPLDPDSASCELRYKFNPGSIQINDRFVLPVSRMVEGDTWLYRVIGSISVDTAGKRIG